MKEQAITEKKLFIWFPLLMAIGTVVFNYAVFYTSFNRLQADYEKHKQDQQTQTAQDQKSYTDIQVRLAEIQKDILYIKDSLTEHAK